mmetsp:Transcript_15361/g.39316  ORF Transcript_15361/g.39316 Transcript_15361/m.39316 type:complete len:154 (-) Transcript_15361:793-1254(-)
MRTPQEREPKWGKKLISMKNNQRDEEQIEKGTKALGVVRSSKQARGSEASKLEKVEGPGIQRSKSIDDSRKMRAENLETLELPVISSPNRRRKSEPANVKSSLVSCAMLQVRSSGAKRRGRLHRSFGESQRKRRVSFLMDVPRSIISMTEKFV